MGVETAVFAKRIMSKNGVCNFCAPSILGCFWASRFRKLINNLKTRPLISNDLQAFADKFSNAYFLGVAQIAFLA
jgi:hypothetical protein